MPDHQGQQHQSEQPQVAGDAPYPILLAGNVLNTQLQQNVGIAVKVKSSKNDSPINFLDLPAEIRLMIYERLPLQIKHYTLDLSTHKQTNVTKVTAILPSLPLGILRTCRVVYDEANKFMQKRVDEEILDQPPKLIYTVSTSCSRSIPGLLVKH